MIFKNLQIRSGSDSIFSEQDWYWTEKLHSPLISGLQVVRLKPIIECGTLVHESCEALLGSFDIRAVCKKFRKIIKYEIVFWTLLSHFGGISSWYPAVLLHPDNSCWKHPH